MFFRKKKEFNLYDEDMEYIREDDDAQDDSYDDSYEEELYDDGSYEEEYTQEEYTEETGADLTEDDVQDPPEDVEDDSEDSSQEEAVEDRAAIRARKKEERAQRKAQKKAERLERKAKKQAEKYGLSEEGEEGEEEILSQEEEEILEAPERKTSRAKLGIIAGLIVLIAAVVIVFVIRNIRGDRGNPIYVQSVRDITEFGSGNGFDNRFTGKVDSQESWNISLIGDSSVETCYVKVNDVVKKGDKLFKYNTEELNLNKQKKQLEIDTAKNEIAQMNAEIKDYESSLKTAGTSEKIELQSQILQSQATIKKDEYTIKSAEQELKKIEKNIKDATVKSKMAGLVKKINTALGRSSSDSDDSEDFGSGDSGSSVYMTIIATGDFRVVGKISETNISAISEGDPMIIRSRVDDEKTWKGVVEKIKTDETAEDSTEETADDYDEWGDVSGEKASTYEFYVSLDNDEGLIMGQHVLIEPDNNQDEHRDGIWLPSSFLEEKDGNYYAWVEGKRNKLSRRKVTIGETDEEGDLIQVTDGLTKADYIAEAVGDLSEGMKTTHNMSEADTSAMFYDDESEGDEFMDEEMDMDDDSIMEDDSVMEEDFDDGSSDGEDVFEDGEIQ